MCWVLASCIGCRSGCHRAWLRPCNWRCGCAAPRCRCAPLTRWKCARKHLRLRGGCTTGGDRGAEGGGVDDAASGAGPCSSGWAGVGAAAGDGVLDRQCQPRAARVDDMSLVDARGRELLGDGEFARGADHWFFTSDRHHLPWHAKNLWLHFYVEQGWLGWWRSRCCA